MNLSERKKHFWNKYIALLSEHAVKSSLYPWYVRHCETFIRNYKETRLKEHSIESVSSYLKTLTEVADKPVWQKQQAIDALCYLFESVRAPLHRQIDWQYWKSSCVDLQRDHDTHYRKNHPVLTEDNTPARLEKTVDKPGFVKAIDEMRLRIRARNYSVRTEKSYVDWLQRFIQYSHDKSVDDLAAGDVVDFMQYLAVDRGVAPKTQSAALNALSFYFKRVKQQELGDISHFVRAKPRQKLPVILTKNEVALILDEFRGMQKLVVSLLYGAGLRIMEVVRLRVQDIDFGFNQIIVREGKGNKERVVPLPAKLIELLKKQLLHVRQLHDEDVNNGYGSVYMPPGLEKKFGKSSKQWVWQYVFPMVQHPGCLSGYGPTLLVTALVRTRMPGGVGGRGIKTPFLSLL